ncbi:MAG: UbiA family prenyltransferase, partial [Limisphaerales bacterium]
MNSLKSQTRPSKLKTLLILGRISNLPTVWSNLILGWLMGHAEPSWPILGWLCLGGSLAYVGGMYLNDAMDVSFDRSFRPERPIPAGAISLLAVHCLGWGQLLLGA